MTFEVKIDSPAMADLQSLRAYDRSAILDSIERILTTAPMQISKSRIKRLRGIVSPQYRLRVGEFRVFYDVRASTVYVMRVLIKSAVAGYVKELGHEIQNGKRGAVGPGNGQGG